MMAAGHKRSSRTALAAAVVIGLALVGFRVGSSLGHSAWARSAVLGTAAVAKARGPVGVPPRQQVPSADPTLIGAAGAAANPPPLSIETLSAPPRYHPRDPREWQGMRVDVTRLQAACETAAQCGMALGCLGANRGCGPCTADSQCDHGEVCALDHCLHASRAGCRSYRDCPAGVQCLLTGISSDPRGNAEMSGLCADQVKDLPEQAVEVAPAQPAPKRPVAVTFDVLQERLAQDRKHP